MLEVGSCTYMKTEREIPVFDRKPGKPLSLSQHQLQCRSPGEAGVFVIFTSNEVKMVKKREKR